VKLERPLRVSQAPDVAGGYILKSNEDPCYENVAALGAEFIGWTLVANEEAGPLGSLYLEADGTSRQPKKNPQAEWAPDLEGRLFDPSNYFPFAAPERYAYQHGYSKRTLLGGYLPVADIAVWNPEYGCGYEVMMLLPPGAEAQPIARMRMTIPAEDVASYNGTGSTTGTPRPGASSARWRAYGTAGTTSMRTQCRWRSLILGCWTPRAPALRCADAAIAGWSQRIRSVRADTRRFRSGVMRCFRWLTMSLSGRSSCGV
jgi:hypothetical protein